MIYDVFPFFNEIPLLELRIAELSPVVDVFCLVELPRTFTDLPKPLHFHENRAKFEHFGKEIRTFLPAAVPSGPHPTVDWFQRRQLGRFLIDADPEDVVLLSDVDEIPNRDAVAGLLESGIDHPFTFNMDLFYHRVDLKDPGKWLGTVIAPRKSLGKEPDMQELRENRGQFPQVRGGWHFSWLGDERAIAEKLEAVDILRENQIYNCHEMKEPPKGDTGFLRACYELGEDMFQRGRRKMHVPIEPGTGHPHEIEEWLQRYPQYAKLAVMP